MLKNQSDLIFSENSKVKIFYHKKSARQRVESIFSKKDPVLKPLDISSKYTGAELSSCDPTKSMFQNANLLPNN